jgi:hypothetical protein
MAFCYLRNCQKIGASSSIGWVRKGRAWRIYDAEYHGQSQLQEEEGKNILTMVKYLQARRKTSDLRQKGDG